MSPSTRSTFSCPTNTTGVPDGAEISIFHAVSGGSAS
jgi:hypothetical protein